MQTRTFLEELEAQAKERGIGQGKEEGLRESIQVVCKNRGLILSPAHIEHLQSCHDHATLMSWLELAMSAMSPEDIFG